MAALFLDTGLGKTNYELAWAEAVEEYVKKPVLIFAPLCVSKQIQQEAEKFNFDVIGVRDNCKLKSVAFMLPIMKTCTILIVVCLLVSCLMNLQF